ncbi:MAG: TonB-dependent receptor [Rhizobiaceae bacterium]
MLATVALVALLAAGQTVSADDLSGSGFSISVDGETLAGDVVVPPVSGAARHADIQIKFDGLDVEPLLNVSTSDLGQAYRAGETVAFRASSNYPAWIERGEVLVYEMGPRASARPIASLPVDGSGHAAWTVPEGGEGSYAYVLRVHDAEGRYDETAPLTLVRTESTVRSSPSRTIAAGEGEDRTAIRNIPVHGGAVTVYGSGLLPGETVTALGDDVPVDAEGRFVSQRILPPGEHQVDVSVAGPAHEGLAFSRSVTIPENEWFYVAIADLTVGKRFGGADMVAAEPGEYDEVYTRGRLAFYLKGKVKGKTLITAAADTGEDRVENLFKGFSSKDPRQVLKRIDPDSFYPVYGDDSSAIDDAPTDGKFYVRVERGDSHVLWGRYKAEVNGSRLLNNERALYGAKGVWRSEATAPLGERRHEVKVYAAQPGTLPQRDVLRGTGGSAYFLTRQDIVRGSETLTVVVRDPLSGRTLTRRALVAGEDYDINPLQGVVILKKPLQSTASDGGVVREGALGDREVNLVATYEYTPTGAEVDEYSYGGQARTWVGDHVRVGVTGMSEETGPADQKSAGVDLHLRATDSTYLDAEFATTRGPGYGRALSTDGGLTLTDDPTAGARTLTGSAWSLRGELDLADIDPALRGRLSVWYEEKRRGFSSFDQDIDTDQRSLGAAGAFDIGEDTTVRLSAEDYADAAGRRRSDGSVEAERKFGERWALAGGLTYTHLADPVTPVGRNGQRLDAGLRLAFEPDDDTKLYAFGQGTVVRRGGIDRNDRVGVGASRRITEKIGVEGEVSYGTSGIGALAAVTYDPTADDRYYAGYRLDADQLRSSTLDGADLGAVVVGARRRLSDVLTSYAESNYDMFGRRRSLTQTYGVEYTPDKLWALGGAFEAGRIVDPNASDFDRKALSLSASYRDDDRLTGSLKGEARAEESEDGRRDRNSFLLSGALGSKLSEDWRLLAGFDAVVSKSDQSILLDGDYLDGRLGFAYRPVDHDRLAVLAKYQFLYDLPGPQQVTVNGALLGPAQRSHVLSADVTYDVNRYLTLGAKYGLRLGEVSVTRAANDFVASSAQLGILRADIRFLEDWDAMVEARALSTGETKTIKYGALLALYRHVGGHMKVGAGYNFSHFSDDLTDLTYDDQGAFINAVGKF